MYQQTKSNTFLILLLLLTSFSCSKWTNRAKGGTIGASSGAVVGGVIGKKAGNTAAGVIIGAAVGGTTGYLIGKYMDKQAAEIRRDIARLKTEVRRREMETMTPEQVANRSKIRARRRKS